MRSDNDGRKHDRPEVIGLRIYRLHRFGFHKSIPRKEWFARLDAFMAEMELSHREVLFEVQNFGEAAFPRMVERYHLPLPERNVARNHNGEWRVECAGDFDAAMREIFGKIPRPYNPAGLTVMLKGVNFFGREAKEIPGKIRPFHGNGDIPPLPCPYIALYSDGVFPNISGIFMLTDVTAGEEGTILDDSVYAAAMERHFPGMKHASESWMKLEEDDEPVWRKRREQAALALEAVEAQMKKPSEKLVRLLKSGRESGEDCGSCNFVRSINKSFVKHGFTYHGCQNQYYSVSYPLDNGNTLKVGLDFTPLGRVLSTRLSLYGLGFKYLVGIRLGEDLLPESHNPHDEWPFSPHGQADADQYAALVCEEILRLVPLANEVCACYPPFPTIKG